MGRSRLYNQRSPRFHVKEFVDRYVPNETFYLAENDRDRLSEAGRPAGPALPAGTCARRIMERLLIDLSWASSRMEGNTYSILDTERLLRYGEAATGKDRKEALMILNHKEAIEYVIDSLDLLTYPSLRRIKLPAARLPRPGIAQRILRTPPVPRERSAGRTGGLLSIPGFGCGRPRLPLLRHRKALVLQLDF